MNIPVVINNRDLLTWPKAMVERIKKYQGVGEIIIVDNNSTYPPLLEWYNTNPCRIVKCRNYGHTGPWDSGVIRNINSPLYVVTDSDLGLDDTPDDTLLYLQYKLTALSLNKIGLGLNWKIVPSESPYYKWVNSYEKNRWESSKSKDGVKLDVPIDTTFALYKKNNYFIGGASADYPYMARHYPWELTIEDVKNNEEFLYYLKHANQSCSYKRIVKSFSS